MEDFCTPEVDNFHCTRDGFWFKAEPKGGQLVAYMNDTGKVIRRKSWPELFEAVLSGKKKFEVRLNEFEVNVGDIIVMREFRPDTQQYTGRTIMRRITYVLDTNKIKVWTRGEVQEKGLLIFSLEPIKK